MARRFKPKLFIASSSENLRLATAVHTRLEDDAQCTVWDQGTFKPSRNTLQALLAELLRSDFAVFIMAPDDVISVRDVQKKSVRDNVIFELGMFVGRLGIERCYMLVPSGVGDIHLPTDLTGITSIPYDASRSPNETVSAVSPACAKIVAAMHEHVGDEHLSRLDLSGSWRGFFVEQTGRRVIVEDDVTAVQNGRKLTGYYKNDDVERDTFSFNSEIAKDTVSGSYSIGSNVHTGAGTFQLRADETCDWLEGYCTWVNYPEGSIGQSKHVWYRSNSDQAELLRDRALRLMGEEVARQSKRPSSKKSAPKHPN